MAKSAQKVYEDLENMTESMSSQERIDFFREVVDLLSERVDAAVEMGEVE